MCVNHLFGSAKPGHIKVTHRAAANNWSGYYFSCLKLAGWLRQNPVAASRSSRHQSKNRLIFFARSRSSLVLKPFTVFAVRESVSSIFHLDTTWKPFCCPRPTSAANPPLLLSIDGTDTWMDTRSFYHAYCILRGPHNKHFHIDCIISISSKHNHVHIHLHIQETSHGANSPWDINYT